MRENQGGPKARWHRQGPGKDQAVGVVKLFGGVEVGEVDAKTTARSSDASGRGTCVTGMQAGCLNTHAWWLWTVLSAVDRTLGSGKTARCLGGNASSDRPFGAKCRWMHAQ